MFWGMFSKTGLSLERLHSFCRVAQVESFTIAAEGDSNRQTLYSRQVKELEVYFETELFQRKGRTVTLTENGRQLHSLLCEYFSALEDFSESCSGEIKSYVIGAGDSIIQWMLLPKLPQIQGCFGKAKITFKNQRTNDIIHGLEEGTVDFGIVRADAVTSRLSSCDLGVLKFALFYPVDQAPPQRDSASLLSHFAFAGMEGSGSYQTHIRKVIASQGIIMKHAVNCSSFPMMAKAVQTLSFAAILPEIAVEELPAEHFQKVELAALKPLERQIVICWNHRLARVNPILMRTPQKLVTLLT